MRSASKIRFQNLRIRTFPSSLFCIPFSFGVLIFLKIFIGKWSEPSASGYTVQLNIDTMSGGG